MSFLLNTKSGIVGVQDRSGSIGEFEFGIDIGGQDGSDP